MFGDTLCEIETTVAHVRVSNAIGKTELKSSSNVLDSQHCKKHVPNTTEISQHRLRQMYLVFRQKSWKRSGISHGGVCGGCGQQALGCRHRIEGRQQVKVSRLHRCPHTLWATLPELPSLLHANMASGNTLQPIVLWQRCP